ncbi:hypothetical protein BC628DRAFT_968767 [Trametes gibbosa]|nr:hypothetical protein BC628DRAFT_968767 [Trametes gibbosa]
MMSCGRDISCCTIMNIGSRAGRLAPYGCVRGPLQHTRRDHSLSLETAQRPTAQCRPHNLHPNGFPRRHFHVWNRQWIALVVPGVLLAGDLNLSPPTIHSAVFEVAAAFIGQSLAQGMPQDFDTLLVPSPGGLLIFP